MTQAPSAVAATYPTREQLRQQQAERLRKLVAAVTPTNPFWTKKFAAAGCRPERLQTLADLANFPTTQKKELVEDQLATPPYGTNLSEPVSRFNRLHQTSGTTSAPLRWLDTPASWDWVSSCWRQIFEITRTTADDAVAFPFSFGPFLGFWAAFDAASRMGALCLPAGGLTSQARLQMIRDNRATVICCTPTYALRLAEVAEEEQIDLASSAVRSIIVAGEPGGSVPSLRSAIEKAWGARVFDHWGMTEVGPLAVECPENPDGLHVLETECIAEILDPASQRPVPAGSQGELVITNLGRTGSPLFRYRTGDLVVADTNPCPCGRHFLRLKGGILGRLDDMVTIRGNNVFPSSIEGILREFAEIAEYRIDVETHRAMQHIKITIEPQAGTPAEALVEKVGRTIRDRLHFQAEVVDAPPGALPRFELKSRRFFRDAIGPKSKVQGPRSGE
ncbi:MAG TPA: AMP-binding protein [Planctomycetaceae bacterium]|jgi:phenylacetate-CoA ligase|nr:AMP-binding protein [Planctomycetaceae bacterium]